ncbi:Decarboxylating D-malate dehydrogenase [Geobacillus sp. BCO2]|nr:Decarboxylating D-malate dehydrogenase [Geobacillus sp. BCO2]
MKKWEIAVIPGDGIGKEVVPAALDVLKAVADVHGGISFSFTEFPWSCDYYMEHGKMMPDDGLETLRNFDAIFLGAVGNPKLVPDHISLWGLLLKIRREFEQVINIRPAKYFRGLSSPLAEPREFDFIVVRENSEGNIAKSAGASTVGKMKSPFKTPSLPAKGRSGRCVMRSSWRESGNGM